MVGCLVSEIMPSPKLREQAILLYEKMAADSITEEDGSVRWSGAFTRLASELGIATGSYGKISSRLVKLGCMSFYQRGNMLQQSIIILHFSPSEVEWKPARQLTVETDGAMLSQQIEDVRRRLGDFDIPSALLTLTEVNKELQMKITKQEMMLRRLAIKLGVDPNDLVVD